MENESLNVVMQQEQVPSQLKAKKPVKAVVLGVLVLLAFLAVQLVISSIGYGVYMASCVTEAGGDMEAATQIYMDGIISTGLVTKLLVVTTFVSVIIALIWYRFGIVKKMQEGHWQELKSQVLHVRPVVLLTFGAIGCYSLALLIAQVIGTIMPSTVETYNELMGTALSGSEVLSFLAVVIIAPVAEELIFRGIIFRILEKNFNITAAIIIQAVLFGIYHLNILQGLYVLPLALLLGFVAYKTKSAVPCIYIHMVNNLMPTLLSLLPESTPIIPVAVVILAVCAVLVFIAGKGVKEQQTA